MPALPYNLDEYRLPCIGAIVLQADETLEGDLRRAFPAEKVDLYISRVPSGAEVTRETLAAMADDMTASAALFPPVPLAGVAYGCTSGASVIGPARVAELVKAGCSAEQVTDPLTALIIRCQRDGITRLALLSPYIASVSQGLIDALSESGIETVSFGSFEEAEEAKVARIDKPSLIEAACEIAKTGDAQAVFLSCTNLKTHDALLEVARRTGMPALSSNSVLIDHLRQMIG
ncbi:Asp/Glu racemase [Ahrensia sp. R2A130]|uniref:maleate cis-trans isomerase family protein n=1 Tax=Ahrensia sp. R2A130 TaxID=744979 RepID=UPI0001E08BF4|nr:Asp/Glu racemase [Ahrensia sp. R2A130]EFL89956.1 Asp/Glu/Hydantoin racemase family protein [Ahrensia sp. R2A130]